MADFLYKYSLSNTTDELKFKELYKNKIEVVKGFNIFYNENTITHIINENNKISVLGYVYPSNSTIEVLLSDIANYSIEEYIIKIKKELLGQYIIIISSKDNIYIFSDFLQTRSIYYNVGSKVISSSFAAMRATNTNDYKVFEFLAMRHCIYPAWLNNTTIDENIQRIRAYEYLKIDIKSGKINVGDIIFTIDNCKIESLKELKSYTLSILRNNIRHPQCKDKQVVTTITGGFDSRFTTALIKEYYNNVNLRISTFKGQESLDYSIASQVSKVLSSPLINYETDLIKQKERFFFITDGLTPRENAIMIELLKHTHKYELGFGGAYGTELYSSVEQNTINELVEGFCCSVRQAIKADETYYHLFKTALQNEFKNIEYHYQLKDSNIKDIIKLFRLINTGYFSSQIVSAYNIYGLQYEIFGTFPVIEAGLKIPYKYMGSKFTFGRFYMIPKALVEQINLKVSKINTTHFCPMRPLSINSFISYTQKKLNSRKFYKKQAKLQQNKIEQLSYDSKNIRYTSNYWFEGFMKTYLSQDNKNNQ